jgi:parvulin-like peptidyl-prolyl isomerase
VAAIGDRKVTAGELEKLTNTLPADVQRNYQSNRKEFLKQYFLMEKLAGIAEKAGLPNETPTKERLAWMRMQTLAQAQVESAYKKISVTEEMGKAYFEKNKSRFTEAQVKVIYISFGTASSKSPTEAEAKAKAEKLVKELRGGADFGQLAKANSEDPTSAEKGGDLGEIKATDALPEDVKQLIFAMKPMQISDPIRQPNGFYIFRTDAIKTPPYEQVKDKLFEEIKQAEFRKWMDATSADLNLKIENEAFFAAPSPAPAPAK